MKKSVYLENIEKCIRNQIKWQNITDEEEKRDFIKEIEMICMNLLFTPIEKINKPKKTRHG